MFVKDLCEETKIFLDKRPRNQITDWEAAQVKHSNTDSHSQEKKKNHTGWLC